MAAGLLMWLAPNRSSSIKPGIFCASALAPFVLWGLFMFVHEGSFGPGQSKQDLGTNLSESVAKVLLQEGLAPSDGQPPAWLPERLTLLEYARYVVRYPRGFAILYSTSALVMVVDSGIGRLYVDLMGFNADKRQQLIDAGIGWRAQLNNHGPIAMLRQGWKIAPQTLTVGVLGGVVFLLLDLGVVISYVRILRNASRRATGMAQLQQTWIRWFLPTVPLYVLITSEVVAYGASRLRSPAEFAWAILACFGWMSLSGSIALDNNEGSLSDRTHQSAQ